VATLFITGFPGFLASELLPRLLRGAPADTIATCLVQQRYLPLARARAAEIVRDHADLDGRIRLVEGDIREPDLGLGDTAQLQRETTAVFHLAAVYDLAVAREPAMAVNVHGTRHVLDFAEACPDLERVHYVSTCYVSGDHAGVFREEDLQQGQRFLNHYEETKFLAEFDVQARMARGLPATIYRPSIVVGDSLTGATQKYDGPYHVIQWLLRQPSIAVLPGLGDATRYRANMVPRDYVVAAMAQLAARHDTKGNVYQLCDPDPPTVADVIRILAAATQRRIVRVPLTAGLAKGALRHVPGMYRLMKIPPQAVDYFAHPAHHTCEHTLAALAGSGISCPPFADYAGRLVDFMRRHPEVASHGLA
jgi:nucleoside-diphosphate-sugar epimerase